MKPSYTKFDINSMPSGLESMLRILLSKHILIPLFWTAKRLPVIEKYNYFKKIQFDQKSKYIEKQNERVSQLLEYALNNINFYNSYNSPELIRLIRSNPREALGLFPILTKDVLRKSFASLHGAVSEDTLLNSSGGSTGEPVQIYQDKSYLVNILAAKMMMYNWAGLNIGESTVKLWGAERDLVKGGKGIKQWLADLILNMVTINAFRLNTERMKSYVNEINKHEPVCLEGYAESLFEFASFIDEQGLEVYSPHTIVSSAGTLYPHMRECIEKVFSARVFDRYGSREAGDMASECSEHNGLHIFGETTIIEVVDEGGNEVNIGEEGEILVTNLTNYAMPLIRYKIGDRAVRGRESCECGRPYPMLERVVGRSGSSFRTQEGGVVLPEFFIHLIGVMCNDGSVGKFQVIQDSNHKIIIRLVPSHDIELFRWKMEKKAIELIKQVMGENCVIETIIEKEIELTPTGKHLYTICKLHSN